ncbi:MAG: hypothetical protein LQ341_002399 [Variospora aurantia]|nr:MAG: hypothetical protein LQ341_002399 [Variospora aurantia]
MGVEEAFRILAAQAEKVKHRKTEKALAEGFASLEEYEQHQLEEQREQEIRDENAINEHCLATGKSRQQYQLEKEEFIREQIRRHPKHEDDSSLPTFQPCDCEEHAFPFFCLQSLVEYKSQDFPDMMEYSSRIHHLEPEDIKIQDTDKSKRLDQELLEQCWIRRPDNPTMDIPFWAKADGVVQQIIRQNACQEAPISPSPSPLQPPSLLSDNTVSASPSANDVVPDLMKTSMEVESADHSVRLPYPHEAPLMQVSSKKLPTSYSEKHIRNGRPGELRKRRPKPISKAADWHAGKDSRIIKTSWKPALGLRSRNITKFYELGCDGKVASNRP